MSDNDGEGFGALFDANEAVTEYPIEKLVIDRSAIACEGCTSVGFMPLLNCFDGWKCASASAGDGGGTQACPVAATKVQQMGNEANDKDVLGTRSELSSLRDGDLPSKKPDIIMYHRNKSHSLWGHKLWNAAKYLVKRIDAGWIDVRGKAVLELGAGLAIPSLAAFHCGARLCVVTDYPDSNLLDIIQRNVAANCYSSNGDGPKPEEEAQQPGEWRICNKQVAVVEPLLWGNAEHISKVMSYTSGVGFDIVILSDILFNHVCNDDLAGTLAATLGQNSRASCYCVFSHHRAHKQLQDFEFFDKCVARGLDYKQIDEEDYPLMFPEDRGPVEVRKPVKCYKITRRYDTAGPALGAQSKFDVVIQGTGMVQAYLSAALSRSGLKVLHCDGEGEYGGVHQTLSLLQLRGKLRSYPMASQGRDTPKGDKNWDADVDNASLPFALATSGGIQTPVILVDRCPDEERKHQSLSTPERESSGVLNLHHVLVDSLPTTYVSNGITIQQLVASDMVRTMEFQAFSDFVFLHPKPKRACVSESSLPGKRVVENDDAVDFRVVKVPLTRSAIFTTDAIGLIDKRRVMKFVKDVSAPLAEELHAHGISPVDDVELQRTTAKKAAEEAADHFANEAKSHSVSTLSALLEKKYGLSKQALDIVTLMGEVEVPSLVQADGAPMLPDGRHTIPDLLRSVEMFRQIVSSVGLYRGPTPFLQPLFGASEMVQALCRTSAVWGGVVVLRRSLRCVGINEEKETQYAVLSNGQWVPTKVIVMPRELLRGGSMAVRRQDDWQAVLRHARRQAGETNADTFESNPQQPAGENSTLEPVAQRDVRRSRVVVVLRRPLITWAHICESAVRGKQLDVTADTSDSDASPSVVALLRVCAHSLLDSSDNAVAKSGAVVQLTQHSHLSNQVPPGSAVVLHFTADAAALPQAELEEFVWRHFYLKRTSGDNDDDGASERSTSVMSLPRLRFLDDDVIFFCSFTISRMQAALDGLRVPTQGAAADRPSATFHSHPYAIAESLKLQRATEKNRRRLLRESDASCKIGASEKAFSDTQSDASACSSKHLRIVPVSTLFHGFPDDAQYMSEAKELYERVVDLLLGPDVRAREKYVFMERLPPVPTF